MLFFVRCYKCSYLQKFIHYQQEALNVVCSYFINIGHHWSFHHCFDASTLYSKPGKDQCLDDLREDKLGRLVFTENSRH